MKIEFYSSRTFEERIRIGEMWAGCGMLNLLVADEARSAMGRKNIEELCLPAFARRALGFYSFSACSTLFVIAIQSRFNRV